MSINTMEDNNCREKFQLTGSFKIFREARSFLASLFRWNFHSKRRLDSTENVMLSNVKMSSKRFFVDIGDCIGTNDKIWTLSMNTESKNIPIVLLHGYVSALAFWMFNLDALAEQRPVFAIDLLGFGKSSRPKFAEEPQDIEAQYVMFLEEWRNSMNIPRMILLGHSLGGYICTAYSLKFPERVEHLILADPWGFSPVPEINQFSFVRRSLMKIFTKFTPFSMVRFAGPLAPQFLRFTRQDIVGKFESVFEDRLKRTVSEYIFHCNNIDKTGELAFHRLLKDGPFPKNPIGEKVATKMCKHIPITFIYGKLSWIDSTYGIKIRDSRPLSYTKVEVLEDSGHKVFSDNYSIFNKIVIDACTKLKENKSLV